MALLGFLIKPFANFVAKKIKSDSINALAIQDKILINLLENAKNTVFGKEHQFNKIKNYTDFTQQVPVNDYEGLRHYIDKIIEGERDILWKGLPSYFAKTSGTTSGLKYIPITKESMPNHFGTARNAVFCYLAESRNYAAMNGKMIFLSGSPEMESKNGILTGRLSGIVNHHIPAIFRTNQLPTYATNCIDDWEKKVDAIANETLQANMTLISGIPPWVEMYFEALKTKSGKTKIKDIFPNFSLYVHGGVNYEPYRTKIEQSVGKKIDTIDTYPASEGFIAFQDSQHNEGLLLNVNSGIFFEFIPANEIFNANPTRLSLHNIELNVNYVIILNTNAGLWGYNIGDTVKFVSKNPYRIVVTGRIKHYISAFGEHVIGEEVDAVMNAAIQQFGLSINEFTVAPNIQPKNNQKPFHHWYIAFNTIPENIENIAQYMNDIMCKKNAYYDDLINGNILQCLKIVPLEGNAFIQYMKREGKLGGQNKVPRLSNNRDIVDKLN
jgi:hypothetical protein